MFGLNHQLLELGSVTKNENRYDYHTNNGEKFSHCLWQLTLSALRQSLCNCRKALSVSCRRQGPNFSPLFVW